MFVSMSLELILSLDTGEGWAGTQEGALAGEIPHRLCQCVNSLSREIAVP